MTNREEMKCGFPGCDRKRHCKGWCNGHYEQQRKGKPLTPLRLLLVPETRDEHGRKQCTNCLEWLGESLFSRTTVTKDGRNSSCTRCQVLRRFGLNRQTYATMLAQQGGGCAICHELPGDGPNFHVDHDHSCCPGDRSCGKCVRGILCGGCNVALGYMLDDPVRLRAAASYLEAR